MRTLTVIAEMGSGGAETVVDLLAREAQARGDVPMVASAGGWRAEELAADGVATVHVPLADPGAIAQLRAGRVLRRTVRERRVDLVHAHNVRATVAAWQALAGRGTAPPVLSTVHGLSDRHYRWAARILARCADQVVAVSDDVAERLVSGGLDTRRLTVIENAPAPVRLMDRELARRELDLPTDVPVALCLARLSRPKRQDLLIDAWPDVAEPAVLLLAGDGPERESLEQQVRASSVRDRVRLLGDRRDVVRLLSACDLLVLPSDREGLPMTVLEAMAAGVPVVASDVGGLRSIARPAVRSVVPGSAKALAEAVNETFGNSERTADQVREATTVVQTRFLSQTMAAAYFAAYDELARKKSRAQREPE